MTPLLGSLVGRRRESIQRIVSGCRELGFGAPAIHLGKLLSESFGARIGRSLATPASCDPTRAGSAGLFLWRVACPDDRHFIFQVLRILRERVFFCRRCCSYYCMTS